MNIQVLSIKFKTKEQIVLSTIIDGNAEELQFTLRHITDMDMISADENFSRVFSNHTKPQVAMYDLAEKIFDGENVSLPLDFEFK